MSINDSLLYILKLLNFFTLQVLSPQCEAPSPWSYPKKSIVPIRLHVGLLLLQPTELLLQKQLDNLIVVPADGDAQRREALIVGTREARPEDNSRGKWNKRRP